MFADTMILTARRSPRVRQGAGRAGRLGKWAGAVAVIIVGAAGCGGGQSAAVQGTPSASSSTAPGAGPGGGIGPRPGASGTVAAISGLDLEVQNPTDGQITVHLTGTTKITATLAATAADVKVGACAVVQPAVARTAGSPTAAPSVDPTAPVTARTVTLADPVAGSCTAGTRGVRAPRPAGSSGSASSSPRAGTGGFRGARPAAGLIAAVSPAGFVIRETSASGTAPTVSVTTTGQTSYHRSQSATPAAIKVGSCVVAQGTIDGTGAVTAASVAVQAPTATGCRSGFGRRPGGSAAPGAGTGGNG